MVRLKFNLVDRQAQNTSKITSQLKSLHFKTLPNAYNVRMNMNPK